MDSSTEFIIDEKEVDKYAIARMEICRKCDQLKVKLPICRQCKCFMPVKTRIKSTSCPLNKW